MSVSDIDYCYVRYRISNVSTMRKISFQSYQVSTSINLIQPILIVMILGRFLGYQHPAGEIHLLSPGNAVACAGDDDSTDSQCSDDTVPTVLQGDILNHV